MSAFVKFLVSMVVHLIWQRVGGKGAIPPVRLPRSNKPVLIPTISTWQLMVAMWVLKKFWGQYGGQVKMRLTDTSHPVPRRIGSWLPDVDTNSAPSATSATAPAPSPPSPNRTPSNLKPSAAPASSPPAPHYNTQRLDDAAGDDAQSAPSTRPSLLSSLRRSPSGSKG